MNFFFPTANAIVLFPLFFFLSFSLFSLARTSVRASHASFCRRLRPAPAGRALEACSRRQELQCGFVCVDRRRRRCDCEPCPSIVGRPRSPSPPLWTLFFCCCSFSPCDCVSVKGSCTLFLVVCSFKDSRGEACDDDEIMHFFSFFAALETLTFSHRRLSTNKNIQSTTPPPTTIKLSVHKKVRFGESVLAVGSGPALGNWNPAESRAALRWSEGDVWTGELPGGGGGGAAEFEFKFVVVRGGGEIVEWEEGGNRVLSAAAAAAGGDGSGVVAARWGETGAKKASAASASSSSSSSSSSKSKREAAKAREAAASAPSPLGMRGRGGEGAGGAGQGGAGSDNVLAPGGAAWVGAETRFMRSNEHSGDRGEGIRWDHEKIDDGAAGGPSSRSFVAGDERAASFLAKLELTKSVLSPSSLPKGRGPGLDAVAAATVYLSLVNSGALPCAEAGGHARPSRHAAASRVVFRALEWGIGDPKQPREVAALSRRLHARLPSFADEFTAATPLTRVRDLAHRNDIPQELKQEIKHTIQNKLHRNAGPEDLVATESLLARLRSAPGGTYPDAFLKEFELFARELREFFNASELEDMLRGLLPSLDAAGEQVIDRVLGCKRAADNLPQLSPSTSSSSSSLTDAEATSHLNVLVDALHAATTARALLASGLASGLRTDAPDSSLAMRQRWRVADARLEDYIFVLLSRCAAAGRAWRSCRSPRAGRCPSGPCCSRSGTWAFQGGQTWRSAWPWRASWWPGGPRQGPRGRSSSSSSSRLLQLLEAKATAVEAVTAAKSPKTQRLLLCRPARPPCASRPPPSAPCASQAASPTASRSR